MITIENKILETIKSAKEQEHTVQIAKMNLEKAELDQNMKNQEVNRLLRLVEISSHEHAGQWYTEHITFDKRIDYTDYLCITTHNLNLGSLTFSIRIAKNNKNETIEYNVDVKGTEEKPGKLFGNSKTYSDDYLIYDTFSTLMERAQIETILDSEEKSNEFVFLWKDRIENKFKDVINQERELIQQIKKEKLLYNPDITNQYKQKSKDDISIAIIGVTNAN